MTKLVLGTLTLLAFVVAAYIVLLKRPLPDPNGAVGLRRRFFIAVVLACSILSAPGAFFGPRTALGDDPEKPVQFQEGGDEEPPEADRAGFVDALKAIWQTLDSGRSDEFRKEAEASADKGLIRRKVAGMLSQAYREVSYHFSRTKGTMRRTCYRMTAMGSAMKRSRSEALKQVDLLRKAFESGAIDSETAKKARATLAREIETFHLAGELSKGDRLGEQSFYDLVSKSKIQPGDAASEAASILVELEGGPIWDATPGERLQGMKKRVEALLQGGPAGSDWNHPALRFNLTDALGKAGLVSLAPRMSCYSPPPGPAIQFAPERNKELRELQGELLDKNVKAGILTVELAEKIKASQARGEMPDLVKEKDIASYQKKVRRVVRLLFRRGELTSAFVKRMERAIDLEIIVFDELKALRHDLGFHLRPALASIAGEAAERILAKHGLIPRSRNHRYLKLWPGGKPGLSDADKEKLASFEKLLDGDSPVKLPGDKKTVLRSWSLPREHTELRKELRRACRALVGAGLARAGDLGLAAWTIGIPIVGRIQ